MGIDSALTHDLVQRLREHRESLVSGLCSALRETTFSNHLLIVPRRLNAIGREEVDTFIAFLEQGEDDEQAVRAHGRRLAVEGLGHSSVLGMTEALRRTCWDSVFPDDGLLQHLLAICGHYLNALMAGYMAGREESILREQERTRRAYLRVHERHADQR